MERNTGDVVQYRGKGETYSGIQPGELVIITGASFGSFSVQSVRHGGAHLTVTPDKLSAPVGVGMLSAEFRAFATDRRQALYSDLCKRSEWPSVPVHVRQVLKREAAQLAQRYDHVRRVTA